MSPSAVPHAASCLLENAWVCPEYVTSRRPEILAALSAHVQITVVSVVIGALVALPLAVLARRVRAVRFTKHLLEFNIFFSYCFRMNCVEPEPQ